MSLLTRAASIRPSSLKFQNKLSISVEVVQSKVVKYGYKLEKPSQLWS